MVQFRSMAKQKDPRVAKGLRHISVWVTPELGRQLDEARDLVPMQRYVTRLLESVMSQRQHKLPTPTGTGSDLKREEPQ